MSSVGSSSAPQQNPVLANTSAKDLLRKLGAQPNHSSEHPQRQNYLKGTKNKSSTQTAVEYHHTSSHKTAGNAKVKKPVSFYKTS